MFNLSSCSLVPVILVAYAEVVPEALDGLAGEERIRLYEMPRLEVRPNPEGVRGQRDLSYRSDDGHTSFR
jgi:hypothetical protein